MKSGRVGAFVAAAILAASAQSQGLGVELLWESAATQSTVGEKSLDWTGAGGLLVTNGRRGGCELDYLFPTAEAGSLPAWSAPTCATDGGGVVSASDTGQLVATAFAQAAPLGSGLPSRIGVRLFQGLPAPATTTFDLPVEWPSLYQGSFGAQVRADGSSFRVWAYSGTTSRMYVFHYTPQGALIAATEAQLGGPAYAATASRDGATLVLQGATSMRVLTLDSSLPVQSIPITTFVTGKIACDGNGDVIAIASTNGRLMVSRRANRDAPYASLPTLYTQPPGMASAIDVSSDGSTIALGLQDLGDTHSCREQVFALAGTTLTRVHDRLQPGPVGTTILVSAADAGIDGAKVVFGTTGSATDAVPELALWRRATGGGYGATPAWSAQLPGSALCVALSPLDNELAVLRAAQHSDLGTGTCTVALYDLDSDLRVRGIPRIGATVRVQIDAEPGRRVQLFRSSALAVPATNLGSVGILRLANPIAFGGAIGGVDGVAQVELALANGTFVPGATYHFQALRMNPRRLTQQAASFTVLP